MRKWLSLALGTALVVGLAGPSGAARLNWAGTLTSTTGTLPPLNLFGGGVATVNGVGGSVPAHLATLRLEASRGGIEGTATNIITDPEVAGNGIAALILEGHGGTGTLGPISGAIGSTSPLTQRVLPARGLSKICLLSTVCTDFLPLLLTQPTTNGARYQVNTATAVDQTDNLTGTAAFQNVTRMGFAHGPASATTSTAQPSGVLQIVTPSQVRTNLSLGTNVKVSILTEILIHFIPEPGLLLLLGSGVAGLALIGRSRIRK